MRLFSIRAETCGVNVPADKTKAHVMVHGQAAGTYDLSVEYTKA